MNYKTKEVPAEIVAGDCNVEHLVNAGLANLENPGMLKNIIDNLTSDDNMSIISLKFVLKSMKKHLRDRSIQKVGM